MVQINPQWPIHGATSWDGPLLVGLGQIVTQLNAHDVAIATNTGGSGGSGGSSGSGVTITDNGDGTATISGANVVDNGNGTISVITT